ncbi:SGNH/GDSL hydrolase family protein [Actinomadura sp. NPDC049753]|uniref:SGNH/GDSL hydrolase family protein n=1 Tax=Actinomadura sp. NPDC049753 TaxID=3154739 RepID=UPI003411FF1A
MNGISIASVTVGTALALSAVGAVTPASAAPIVRAGWSAGWAAAVQRPVPGNDFAGPNWSMEGFDGQTVRQVVRLSSGGEQVRVRLSNLYGDRPLRITGASVAISGDGAALEPGAVRRLTFGGAPSATIRAGRVGASDRVRLPFRAPRSLTITLYLAGPTGPATFHENGLATTYRATGDHTADVDAGAFAGETSHSYYFLAGVDVRGGHGRGTVVAFGDSITDGHGSTPGANHRYPDRLAERLAAARRPLGVANAGIDGNLLLNELTPCFGEKGVTRFRRDVLQQPGVRTAIVLEGVNDLFASEFDNGCGTTPRVSAAQLITGYRALIGAARSRGVRVVGATLTPFKTPYIPTEMFERAEGIREEVNHWIRTSGEFDAVADFDRALADPEDVDRMRPAYDSGDGIHPNDVGYKAMAEAVDIHRL